MSAIACVLRPAATVSVLASNAVAAVLHRALAGRFAEARAAARAQRTRRAGDTRRFTLPELVALIEQAGLRAGEAHGLRVFSGLVPGALLDGDAAATEALRALEEAAASHPAAAGHRGPAAPARPPLSRGRHEAMGGGGAPDDTGCHILHVDMDAFYASVEIRDRPELRRPAGHRGRDRRARRGAVRVVRPAAFGVRSAMPVGAGAAAVPARGVRAAPAPDLRGDLQGGHGHLRHGHARGRAAGAGRGVPRRRRRAAAARAARRDRRAASAPRSRQQQGITCSVGVAPSKFVAKIASARCKPDGAAGRAAGGGARLPASAAGGRAVGSRGAGRGGAGPAGAAHGGRTSRTLRWPPCSASSAPRTARTWPPWPGAATSAGSRRARRRRASAPRRRSLRDIDDPDRIRRELLQAVRPDGAAGCGPAATWPGPSRSSCGWPASRR